jgi:hypothetical protein
MGQRAVRKQTGSRNPLGGAVCPRPHPDSRTYLRSPKVGAFEQTHPRESYHPWLFWNSKLELSAKLLATREPKMEFLADVGTFFPIVSSEFQPGSGERAKGFVVSLVCNVPGWLQVLFIPAIRRRYTAEPGSAVLDCSVTHRNNKLRGWCTGPLNCNDVKWSEHSSPLSGSLN